jgi:hypothetical protein
LRRYYNYSIRIYSWIEIKELLEMVGFKILKVYGSYHKEEFTDNSSRMIIVAERSQRNSIRESLGP